MAVLPPKTERVVESTRRVVDYAEPYRRRDQDDPNPRPLTAFDSPRTNFAWLISIVLFVHVVAPALYFLGLYLAA